MTLQKLKTKVCPEDSENTQITHRYESDYEQYLRKRYSIPDDVIILTKQGYIAKDEEVIERSKSTLRERLIQAHFRANELVQKEICEEVSNVKNAMDQAIDDIEILEIQNSSLAMSNLLFQTEIEDVAEKMLSELSHSIRRIAEKSHEKFYDFLTETWSEMLENTPQQAISDSKNSIKTELYDTINTWLKNFKNWLLDSINSVFDDAFLANKSYVAKDLSDDTFEKIKESFENAKKRSGALIENTVSRVQATAQIEALKAQSIELYEIVSFSDEKTCEDCSEMDGKIYSIDELASIGVTTPPFHPNCRCTMIPHVEEETEENPNSWRPSPNKPQDARYLGEPEEVKEYIKPNGERFQTKIGSDGRATMERHHTDHNQPWAHSNPHDHIVDWSEGFPNPSKHGPINYSDDEAPEFKKYEGVFNMKTIFTVPENTNFNFESIDDFKYSLKIGGEIEFEWKNKGYSITKRKHEISISEWRKQETEKLYADVNELLNHEIDGEPLKNIVTKIHVTSRTI